MLRLGFLDSQALSTGTGPKDAAFVASSRDTASARLASASHAHALDSERDSEETVRWKVIRKRGWKLDNQINNDIKTSRH